MLTRAAAAAAAAATADVLPTDNGSRSGDSSSDDGSSAGSDDEEMQCATAGELFALDAASRSVALLAVRCGERPTCGTGFRIGHRYLITAKHVVQPALTVNNDLYDTDAVTATFVNLPALEDLVFTFRKSVHVIHGTNANGSSFAFDFAILEFEEHFESPLPPPLKISLTLDPRKRVHIIGYPNIGNGQLPPKRIDPSCKLVFPGEFRPWEAYPHLNYEEAKRAEQDVFYDCWVQHGASGSPVLQYVNDSLVAVAVHVSGFPSEHYDERARKCSSLEECNKFDRTRRKEYRLFEAGISLGAVHSAMSDELRAIFNL